MAWELEAQGLVERSRVLGSRFLASLRKALAGVAEVAEVRGRGLFLGVEFTDPGSGMPLKGAAVRVATLALREGVLVLAAGASGQVLEISPPLVITEEQMEWAVELLQKVIQVAVSGLDPEQMR